ncbi:MAG TPA: iron-sulfur cluster assembly scaffold protein [Bryobacteraceae bacterium]|nr:iron-sulfur cluster assembly scaffold protein [Bryobacteraceae bacterium]
MRVPPVSPLYSERLLAHFQSPSNAGSLAAPALTAGVENPVCGDQLSLSALIENGRFAQVRFLAKGCTAAIAAGSALTVWLTGKSVDEVAHLGNAEIGQAVVTELDGLPSASHHAAALCAAAVKRLLQSR